MSYFSRLTDIITCNLSQMLNRAEEPGEALEAIIAEMHEGVAGAERSVRSSINNVARLETEIGTQRQEVTAWHERARAAISGQDEAQARIALSRKHEIEDLLAGLEQQLKAAMSTRDHLQTMLNAIQARVAEARRRRDALAAGEVDSALAVSTAQLDRQTPAKPVADRIEAELQELRRQFKNT